MKTTYMVVLGTAITLATLQIVHVTMDNTGASKQVLAPPVDSTTTLRSTAGVPRNASPHDNGAPTTTPPRPADSPGLSRSSTLDANPSMSPTTSANEYLDGTFLSLVEGARGDAQSNLLANWHQQFMEDVPDPAWSSMAQSQAKAYLISSLGADVELVSIQCGATICEIQAASTSADNSEAAANEWQTNMSSMSNESWWHTYGFAAPNSAIWAAPDGRELIVSYLPRAPQESNP